MPSESAVDSAASTEAIAAALLQASRVLVGVAARSLSEIEDVVTLPQLRALVVLETSGPLSLGAFAERLAVNASTAQRMVERLVRAGHVSREVNPDDRRGVVLALTPAGSGLVAEVTRRRRREIERIVRRMSPDSRAAAVSALHEFADAAGEPAVPDQTVWSFG